MCAFDVLYDDIQYHHLAGRNSYINRPHPMRLKSVVILDCQYVTQGAIDVMGAIRIPAC